MTITRNDTDEVYGKSGLVSSSPVVRDITADVNRATLLTQAQQALASNAAALALSDPTTANAAYLAVGAPNNAQVIAQVRALTQQSSALVAQVRSLTAQNNKIIRLLLAVLGIAGTLDDTN